MSRDPAGGGIGDASGDTPVPLLFSVMTAGCRAAASAWKQQEKGWDRGRGGVAGWVALLVLLCCPTLLQPRVACCCLCKAVWGLAPVLPAMLVRALLPWDKAGEAGGDPKEAQWVLELLLQDNFALLPALHGSVWASTYCRSGSCQLWYTTCAALQPLAGTNRLWGGGNCAAGCRGCDAIPCLPQAILDLPWPCPQLHW